MRLGGKTGLGMVLCVVLGVGGPTGWWMWKARVKSHRLQDLLQNAETSAQHDRFAEVYAWVDTARPLASDQPAVQKQLDRLEVRAAGRLRDFPRLLKLYDAVRPMFFSEPTAEEAALWMARFLSGLRRPDEARKLVEPWSKSGRLKSAWLAVEADILLAAGERDAARRLLLSRHFEGREDGARLLRLAMLSVDKPTEAKRYVSEAFAADPANPEVRLFRARLLEAAGEMARARVEYVAAVLAAPDNPMVRHELALFYGRGQDWPNAVKTWEEANGSARLDVLALNGIFWRRVAVGGEASSDKRPVIGTRAEAVRVLETMSPEQYPEPSLIQTWKGAEGSEELWWLGLLGLLQKGREQAALDALESSPYRTRGRSISLSQQLLVVLRWRLKQVAPQSGDLSDRPGETMSPFSQTLLAWSRRRVVDTPTPPRELAEVLKGNHVLAVVLTSAGWPAAACALLPAGAKAGEAPEWSVYAVARSLQTIRGSQAMLTYLSGRVTRTPALDLLNGEGLLLAGQRKEAVEILEKLSTGGGEVGYRAAWILANLALAESRFSDVEKMVTADQALVTSVAGRELVARAAVSSGRWSDADRLYQALGEVSTEGMVWQSRRAFENKQWDQAEALTLKLMELFPDQLEFAANLQRIRAARSQP